MARIDKCPHCFEVAVLALHNCLVLRRKAGLMPVSDSKPDPVNHPAHYNLGGIEVIDAIEAWGLTFKLANVVKYVARADHKGKPLEDLKKAQWYLNREIAQREAAEAKAKVSSGG